MYFDQERNYGWVPARDLSKLDLHRDNAPKERNYPEASFHDARDWVAQRYGFKTWQALSRDSKGLRPGIPTNLESNPWDTMRVGPRGDALQSNEDRERETGRDTNSPEKAASTRINKSPLRLTSFEETLEQQSSHLWAPQRTSLKSDIKPQDRPKAHPITMARTLENPVIMSSTLTSNQTPGRPMPTAYDPDPPAAAYPPISAPSPQIPTPLAPISHAPVAAFRGSEASPSDTYEISAYERRISEDGQVRSQLVWQRSSRSKPCVKLVISADRQTAWAQGGPFELRIDPLDCQQVRLQTPFGQDGHINEHGIGYVTLSQTSGDAIKMTFDRSDDRDGTMGSWRARRFARWLWEQNPKMKP
ncbi:hypothetical protein PG987_000094 [Apiospora arundinis]